MINLLPPYPAALLKTTKERTLAITDLHIGWEMTLSNEGIYVPTQTPRLLSRLLDLVSAYTPERLLILGDVKHTVATVEKTEWRDIPDFFVELRKKLDEVFVIRGNHDGNLDPLLPENVKILPASGLALNDVGFFHGHQWPSPSLLKCRTIVMGHVHPVIAFRDPAGFRITRQVWIKAACNSVELARTLLKKHRIKIAETVEKTLHMHFGTKPKTSQLFIMPSFNDFLGGRPLNERKSIRKLDTEIVVGPVLRSEAIDMKNAEAYLLDGTFLGTLEQLRTMN